jgi:hypothetical protein
LNNRAGTPDNPDPPDPQNPDFRDDDDGDLIDDAPPPPDTPVIIEDRRHDLERAWFLAVFLALFAITIFADLAGSAWLSGIRWAQMKPEVQDIRTFMFQVVGIIIGFYFGTRRRHR